MDRLTKGFDQLNLSRHGGSGGGAEEEWRTVGSPSKRSHEHLTSSHPIKSDPLIISHNCQFAIYQLPKFYTDESILRLVNSVVDTGPDTLRLFLEVTLETWTKQLVILRGVSGSGKSSVATALMATTRKGTICSADDYFKDGKGNYNFNPGRLRDAHESSQLKCRKLMEKEISPVIIDNTNTRRFEMEPYVRLAIENNYAVTVFEPETSWKNDARTLAQKNVHGVPRAKIQEMIDRFEQVVPYLVVEDVRKRMGDVGRNYSPVKAEFEDVDSPPRPGCGPPPGLTAPPPLLGATKLEALIPPSMALTLKHKEKEYQGMVGYCYPTPHPHPVSGGPGQVPPTPLLSEYVLNSLASPSASTSKGGGTFGGGGEWVEFDDGSFEQSSRMAAVFPSDEEKVINTDEGRGYCLTDQNVSFSTGRMKRKAGRAAAAAAAAAAGGGGPGPSETRSVAGAGINSAIPSKPYSESLLQSVEILQAYFPTYKTEDLADLLEKHGEDINEAMNALLDSGYKVAEEVVLMDKNDNQSQQIVPGQAEGVDSEFAHNDRSCPSGGMADDGKPPSPNEDKADWFNLKLPHEFIKKLALMYGSPDDPVIQAMMQNTNGYTTRVPPTLGFAMYRKLVQNAEAKAFKEAEDAARD